MYNKKIFENIYKNFVWNDNNKNIPLSGPGSSLDNTKECSKLLDDFICENECKSVLDLGCGDLTWVQHMIFFKNNDIKYTGIDVVEDLIISHTDKYPEKQFDCQDITNYDNFEKNSLIIIRDVIFHLTNNEILTIFNNIKNKFDFIAITSCKNIKNSDDFNRWRFTEKNIHNEPFNISLNFEKKVNENAFRRHFYIYNHDNFYN